MASVLALGACATTDPASPTPTPAAPQRVEATLVRVVDGDSLWVDVAGEHREVRLIGINAPERGECLADEAATALAALVATTPLILEADVEPVDRFGRLLRYVLTGDRLINAELARQGLVLVREYPPNLARQDELEEAQAVARAEEAGLWAPEACGPATPGMEILELRADPPGRDEADLNGEWVAIANVSTESVDLSGWTLRDTSSIHRFAFPDGFRLAPGAEVAVHSGCGEDRPEALYWCASNPIWDNDGDTAFLLDPAGNIAASHDG